jgi:hypothetical protein
MKTNSRGVEKLRSQEVTEARSNLGGKSPGVPPDSRWNLDLDSRLSTVSTEQSENVYENKGRCQKVKEPHGHAQYLFPDAVDE